MSPEALRSLKEMGAAEIAAWDIKEGRMEIYRASDDELKAIDEADKSGVATEREVSEVFAAFRRG
jgi:hypothetical protein